MLALVLAGLALRAPLQERPAEPSTRERIAALIESANALDSFRARYELEKNGAIEAEFVLAYAAPGRGLLAVERGDGEAEARAETWVVDGVMSVRVDDGKGGGGSGDVDLSEPSESIAAASELLTERFPPAEPGIGPGPIFIMSWGVNAETDKTDFDLKLAYERGDRPALLGWLVRLHREADELTLVDGRYVLEPDPRIHVEISAETGFVERIDLVGQDGTSASVLLRELEVGAVPLGESFEPDPLAADAPDVFAEGAERMRGHPRDFRRSAFGRIDAMLERGEREWDERTRADWRDVLEALHRPFVRSSFAGWRERSDARSRDFAGRLAQELEVAEGDEAVARLREVAANWRGALEANLASSLEAFTRSLEVEGALPSSLVRREALSDIEGEVLRTTFEAEVAAPLLASFDGLVAAAFGD